MKSNIVYLQDRPAYQKNIAQQFITLLKEKGRKATSDRAAAFPLTGKNREFWDKVNAHVRAYLVHSKLKPKD